MREGDGMSCLAAYCLHEYHLLPSDFLRLDRRERAFIAAAIQLRERGR